MLSENKHEFQHIISSKLKGRERLTANVEKRGLRVTENGTKTIEKPVQMLKT